MTLDNLVHKSLEKITPSHTAIMRLLHAAKRNIADARNTSISHETRFDAAYKAIMQCANAALQANGYRTLTSQPGHHQLMLQLLPKTIGLQHTQIVVLDALRKQRNAADYSGDPIPPATTTECIEQAEALLAATSAWVHKQHPLWFK